MPEVQSCRDGLDSGTDDREPGDLEPRGTRSVVIIDAVAVAPWVIDRGLDGCSALGRNLHVAFRRQLAGEFVGEGTLRRAWRDRDETPIRRERFHTPSFVLERLRNVELLTTYHQLLERSFTSSGDTSAATAAAARYAAIIRAAYPDLWPETIRALLVDSAEWTVPMRRELDAAGDARGVAFLLRCFGFGVPNLERALWSAGNSLTLIAQDQLQPFTGAKSNEMNLHALPWPCAELQRLGEVEVELRVTLSYFIEPNPARRGWKDRHRYSSHGLRFAVQKPTESVVALRKRVNKDAREEEEGVGAEGDADGWRLKPNLRGKGSLHHERSSCSDSLRRGTSHLVSSWLMMSRYEDTLGSSGRRRTYSRKAFAARPLSPSRL